MSPLLPFTASRSRGPHRIEVVGELRLDADGRTRSESFACRTTMAHDTGTATILTLRSASAEDVIDLDLQGTLQDDGILMVTISMRIHHPPLLEGDHVDAETTVVPAGASPGFLVSCFDGDGCHVSARGSIAHERSASTA